jgi:hypothetical protein
MAFASFLIAAVVRKVQLHVGVTYCTLNLGLDAAGLSTGTFVRWPGFDRRPPSLADASRPPYRALNSPNDLKGTYVRTSENITVPQKAQFVGAVWLKTDQTFALMLSMCER